MKQTLTVLNQNTNVTKIKGRLLVQNDEIEKEIRINEISSVLLFGNVQITTQALTALAQKGITVTAISSEGKIKYFVLPPNSKNLDLRIKQYETFANVEKKLSIAKYTVIRKIENQMEFLKNYRNSKKKAFKANEIKKKLKPIIEKTKNANDFEEILGHEGNASKIYFEYLSKLSEGEIKFTKRTKRPPEDEANSLLGFTYTITLSLITSIAYGEGFDIYTGFLHSERYDRPSFALDILEFFRANFSDKFFLYLTNKNIITKKDFQKGENIPFVLSQEGKKKFFTHWRKTVYSYTKPSQSVIYTINNELHNYSKMFRNEGN